MFSVSYFLRFAFILICVDQLIKVYISIKFILNDRIYLLFNWLFFEPTINKKGSIFGSILSLDLGIWFYTITIFVVLIFFVQMIWFYKFRYRNSFWINISAIFIISGGVCALLDNILKGGSLDYIGINNLFIADLKDIYLSLGLACFLAEFIETKKVKRLLTLDLKRDLKLLREILFYSKRNIIDLFSQNMIEEENKNK
ncbi:MAG: signal peptidase II [Bacteroidales bacterium]|nr:signal peptidase II [Bacteroidales bacterium]